MALYATYLIEHSRVLSGIVLEGRQSFAQTKDKTGFEVKAFIDSESAKVVSNVLPYKIEVDEGNLVAYFSILVNGVAASRYQVFVRPSFNRFSDGISSFISNFIGNGSWIPDILQGEPL